jgi:hypothetical protein
VKTNCLEFFALTQIVKCRIKDYQIYANKSSNYCPFYIMGKISSEAMMSFSKCLPFMDFWNQHKPIPFDALGTLIFAISILFDVFGAYVICLILQGCVQLRQRVKYLMLFCNIGGLLWSCVSIIRYYYIVFPQSNHIHYLLGNLVTIGDLMAQFEILKLFQFISGLNPRLVSILQWLSLSFCVFCSLGAFVALGFNNNSEFIYIWGEFGAIVTGVYVIGFYFWYQLFLTTKLYQTMHTNSSGMLRDRENQSSKYYKLITEFSFLGVYQLIGLGIWGYGMMAGMGTLDLAQSRMFIRAGECVGQSHAGLSVLFIKRIKEFRFPQHKSRTTPVPYIPTPVILDTLQCTHNKTLMLLDERNI